MKKGFYCRIFSWLPLAAISVIAMNISCDPEEEEEVLVGNWIELSDFEGVPRYDAVSFTTYNPNTAKMCGYVATGYNGEDQLNDLWEYDPERDSWMQRASLPDTAARNGAIGCGTDTRGYIGTGYDGHNKLKDFWEYDPGTDTWTKKADFGGSARFGALAFTINNKCYVGTGFDGYFLKDLWEYDPSADTWTQKTSVGGSKRRDAVGFAVNGKGYVCTGIDNGSYEDDFWEYDPVNDKWTEKNSIADISDESFDDDYGTIIGINKVAFAINNKGYIATGGEGSAGVVVWEYDPSTDLWIEKSSYEGTSRVEAVAFVVGSRGYITTGRSSGYYFDDIWAFEPDAEFNEDD